VHVNSICVLTLMW